MPINSIDNLVSVIRNSPENILDHIRRSEYDRKSYSEVLDFIDQYVLANTDDPDAAKKIRYAVLCLSSQPAEVYIALGFPIAEFPVPLRLINELMRQDSTLVKYNPPASIKQVFAAVYNSKNIILIDALVKYNPDLEVKVFNMAELKEISLLDECIQTAIYYDEYNEAVATALSSITEAQLAEAHKKIEEKIKIYPIAEADLVRARWQKICDILERRRLIAGIDALGSGEKRSGTIAPAAVKFVAGDGDTAMRRRTLAMLFEHDEDPLITGPKHLAQLKQYNTLLIAGLESVLAKSSDLEEKSALTDRLSKARAELQRLETYGARFSTAATRAAPPGP